MCWSIFLQLLSHFNGKYISLSFKNVFIYANFCTEASKLWEGNCINFTAWKYFNSQLDHLLFYYSLCNWYFASTTATGNCRCQSLKPPVHQILYRFCVAFPRLAPTHCLPISVNFKMHSIALTFPHPFPTYGNKMHLSYATQLHRMLTIWILNWAQLQCNKNTK